jgi:dephospho-CoA kinase
MATRFVGLTGGIGSGKSTVAAMLRELGAPVIDADALAREVVEPGQPALREIVERFGPEVLTPDGRLDRPRLAAIVFGDPRARADLEAITHPRIAALAAERAQEHARSGAPVVFYEAALLVEHGLHRGMAGLVVVASPPELQIARLRARDGLSKEEARARLAAQLPLAEKLAVATHVIDNSRGLDETRERVKQVYAALLREEPS